MQPILASVKSFTSCIDERPWVPYTHPDLKRPGKMQILVYKVSREMKVHVEVEALPWKRCLDSVRQGKIDAALGAGAIPFIQSFAAFPSTNSGRQVDSKRSLGAARVMLAKRKNSQIDWKGESFENLKKPIGAPLGTYTISRAIYSQGGQIDNTAKTDEQNIKKLLQNRVDLVAAYEFDLQELIRKHFSKEVSILPIPLVESHYYLAFSQSFYHRNSEFVEAFWTLIGKKQSEPKINTIQHDDLTVIEKSPLR